MFYHYYISAYLTFGYVLTCVQKNDNHFGPITLFSFPVTTFRAKIKAKNQINKIKVTCITSLVNEGEFFRTMTDLDDCNDNAIIPGFWRVFWDVLLCKNPHRSHIKRYHQQQTNIISSHNQSKKIQRFQRNQNQK